MFDAEGTSITSSLCYFFYYFSFIKGIQKTYQKCCKKKIGAETFYFDFRSTFFSNLL